MKYFTEEELRGWQPWMPPRFQDMVDTYREALGYEVDVSKAFGALGRQDGRYGSTSRHNVDRWGVLESIDVKPRIIEPDRWVAIAREVGFTGIGFYPDWSVPGMHLDDRGGGRGHVATWGRIDTPRKRYVGIDKALRSHYAKKEYRR